MIKGKVAEAVGKLKRQPGKDITILGSGALVRSLLRDGLLDELGIMVHPVVMGCGKRLFWEGGDLMGLEPIESKTFVTGGVSLNYRPTVGQDAERGLG